MLIKIFNYKFNTLDDDRILYQYKTILISNRLKLGDVSISIYDIIDSIFYKIAEINKLNKFNIEI